MKRKLIAIRKSVFNYPTYYAFCAGSIATSAYFYILTKDKTLLQVTADQLALLQQGGAVVYDTAGQQLHLVNVAAVEALQNVA